MSMIPTAPGLESLTLIVTQEIQVQATLEHTFAALLEQIGPENDTPDGKKMPMKIEAWPGGRWYRGLGDGNGTPSFPTCSPGSAKWMADP